MRKAVTWLNTTHSNVFAMKGRRETGLYFLKRVGLRVGFLRSGVI